ncbi:MAG: WD40/YVTN/BNR-like repeat-containing protein, partial [Vicinamibacterales bacterium]
AVLGHPYGPNEERGVFRSTDGGQTFEKVFYRDENTGAQDVEIDPSDPDVVYATLFGGRQGPWENAVWGGPGGIIKSTDGGTTWKPLTKGLPEPITVAEIAIAPSQPKTLYAYVSGGAGGRGRGGAPGATASAGRGRGRGGRGTTQTGGFVLVQGGAQAERRAPIYRSDDGGETWTATSTDARVGTSNEAKVIVDPKDPDWLIVTSQVTYKSEDRGKTWTPFKGAPGGDDYQNAWINPNNPNLILLVADQGAVVSVDRGASWSSWYTQSTAAMFHITTDNAFPYRVCGGQQDSGSACVASRGNDGQITMREWHPVGVEEYGYAAPDPLDPDLVYGGKVTRYDRRTGQVSNVGPVPGGRGGRGAASPDAAIDRTVRTQPVVFSMADRHALFYGTNVLWKTIDGGITWKQISPDLTRKTHEAPKSIGTFTEEATAATPNGPEVDNNGARVIYTIGPSYTDINRIWIGTDDGVIATTSDGGVHWTDVTPKQIGSYWKVFMIEPGRFDPLTAYAAVNTLRLDDQNPHLFRTHDGGKTWTEIDNGIPGGAAVSAIREDVKKKGLLFAGSETQVYVSFDDGDHWRSLRLNMAPSSVRDLQVKDDDLIAGTHGRGIWILDDIAPLRQISADTGSADMLFTPAAALRVRWDANTDTPLPPDEIRAPNPPDGAAIDYYLASDASGPVTIAIHQQDGKLVRRYSSDDPVTPLPDPKTNAPLPLYWYRPPQVLSTKAGMHRFMWDVHYQPLPPIAGGAGGRGFGGGLSIAAVPYNTVPAPTTPWVAPGQYTVKLTVNGKTYSHPIVVKQDPRVKTSALAMQQVYTLSRDMYYEAAAVINAANKAADNDALVSAARGLEGVMNSLQAADVQPTAVQLKAIASARAAVASAMAERSGKARK